MDSEDILFHKEGLKFIKEAAEKNELLVKTAHGEFNY